MIFYPWSLIICTTFISMTDPIFLSPGILRWILDRRSLLEEIKILRTDYQRLHVHLTDLNLRWSNPRSWPFLFSRYQITKQWDLTVLDITMNVFQISAESLAEISYHSYDGYRGLYFNCCYAFRWTLTWIWSCQSIVLIHDSVIVSDLF